MDAVLKRSFDRSVAVVGDVHGRLDLLRRLVDRLPAGTPVLFAGDLCDRGPDTRGVIDLLLQIGAIGVRGNHEEWFDAWANGRGLDRLALSPMMGGASTLRSYGAEGTVAEMEAQSWRVPPEHRAFLAGLPVALDLHVKGQAYWLVHAGIPSTEDLRGLSLEQVVPHLARARPATLLWPRNDIRDMLPIGRTVIMGHQPLPYPVDTGQVIAVDTGAATRKDGRLTAVLLPERRFISVL